MWHSLGVNTEHRSEVLSYLRVGAHSLLYSRAQISMRHKRAASYVFASFSPGERDGDLQWRNKCRLSVRGDKNSVD